MEETKTPTARKKREKPTFYCLCIELYDSGDVKVGQWEKQAVRKPSRQEVNKPGMKAYWSWHDTDFDRQLAKARLLEKLIDVVQAA